MERRAVLLVCPPLCQRRVTTRRGPDLFSSATSNRSFSRSAREIRSGCHSVNGRRCRSVSGSRPATSTVTTFERISKRRDVLASFGAYPKPLLLIKAVAPATPNPL